MNLPGKPALISATSHIGLDIYTDKLLN